VTSLFDLLDLGRNENYFDCGAGIVVKKTWARELKEHGVRIRPHNTEILPAQFLPLHAIAMDR